MKVGVIGGGQLAQMLAQSAKPLAIEVYALSDILACSANQSATIILGDQADVAVINDFATRVDLLTFEFEKINYAQLTSLTLPIYPPLAALKTAQDRELEKNCFIANDIPTTQFKIAFSKAECIAAIDHLGLPVIIKTCLDGYDGKGQALIRQLTDLENLWPLFADKRLIVEKVVTFERELSMIAVRGQQGDVVYYPLTENFHQQGILRISKAPYQDDYLQRLAINYTAKILNALHYVGVLAIEFFQYGQHLIANEMAPRVHNSGHWTIEGAYTSQFENHIRAVCGLPLGNTAAKGYSAMINVIGELPDLEKIVAVKHAYVHDYHKMPRPQRKLAHVTICASTEAERDEQVEIIQILINKT